MSHPVKREGRLKEDKKNRRSLLHFDRLEVVEVFRRAKTSAKIERRRKEEEKRRGDERRERKSSDAPQKGGRGEKDPVVITQPFRQGKGGEEEGGKECWGWRRSARFRVGKKLDGY